MNDQTRQRIATLGCTFLHCWDEISLSDVWVIGTDYKRVTEVFGVESFVMFWELKELGRAATGTGT